MNTAMQVRIETLDPIKVAKIRYVGPYNEIGPCFQRLFQWAVSVGAQPRRAFTLSYDNPEVVPAEKLRSDACLELETNAEPPAEITIETVEPGRCAIYTHKGSYEGLEEAYRRFFYEWLPGSGEEMDDRPCMDIYLNTPFDTAPEYLLTDIHLPIK